MMNDDNKRDPDIIKQQLDIYLDGNMTSSQTSGFIYQLNNYPRLKSMLEFSEGMQTLATIKQHSKKYQETSEIMDIMDQLLND